MVIDHAVHSDGSGGFGVGDDSAREALDLDIFGEGSVNIADGLRACGTEGFLSGIADLLFNSEGLTLYNGLRFRGWCRLCWFG